MNKHYEVKMVSYLKSLEKHPKIVNSKVRMDTIKAVINQFATFLTKECPKCSILLVDPIGTKKYARCGNCGYSEKFNPYHDFVNIHITNKTIIPVIK